MSGTKVLEVVLSVAALTLLVCAFGHLTGLISGKVIAHTLTAIIVGLPFIYIMDHE